MKIVFSNLSASDKKEIAKVIAKKIVTESNGTIELDSRDYDFDEVRPLMDICDEVIDFEIWLEVPTADLSNNIPSQLSFSTYIDSEEQVIQRKWSDMQSRISSRDNSKTIRYLDGITSSIQKNDLDLLRASQYRVFYKTKLMEVLNDPNDIYYQEINP